jgi:hypothetical protein
MYENGDRSGRGNNAFSQPTLLMIGIHREGQQ